MWIALLMSIRCYPYSVIYGFFLPHSNKESCLHLPFGSAKKSSNEVCIDENNSLWIFDRMYVIYIFVVGISFARIKISQFIGLLNFVSNTHAYSKQLRKKVIIFYCNPFRLCGKYSSFIGIRMYVILKQGNSCIDI